MAHGRPPAAQRLAKSDNMASAAWRVDTDPDAGAPRAAGPAGRLTSGRLVNGATGCSSSRRLRCAGRGIAGCRSGEALVVTKLDRFARSLPGTATLSTTSPPGRSGSTSAAPCMTRPTSSVGRLLLQRLGHGGRARLRPHRDAHPRGAWPSLRRRVRWTRRRRWRPRRRRRGRRCRRRRRARRCRTGRGRRARGWRTWSPCIARAAPALPTSPSSSASAAPPFTAPLEARGRLTPTNGKPPVFKRRSPSQSEHRLLRDDSVIRPRRATARLVPARKHSASSNGWIGTPRANRARRPTRTTSRAKPAALAGQGPASRLFISHR